MPSDPHRHGLPASPIYSAAPHGDEHLTEHGTTPVPPHGARTATSDWHRRRRRKAPIAAFWSFVVPGGGQLYNRQPWLALAFMVPVVLLVGGSLVAVLMSGEVPLARLLDQRVIVGLLALNAAVMVWRVASILQAHRRRARFGLGLVGTWVTGALVVVVIAMHAAPAPYALKLLETLGTISVEGARTPEIGVRERIPALGSGSSDGELITPPTAPERGRTNILLLGVDSAVGRDHALTDTMMVISLDSDGASAMLSIPRDLVNAPLPNGELYPHKLNSLLQTAASNPAAYPFGTAADTLKAAVGELLGVPIHYFAAVDLAGFSRLVDVVGGVEVMVEHPIADASADLYLQPGRMSMDGDLALRYVRSRHGAGNDDFQRAARQQQVIAAIRNSVMATDLVTTLPRLLDAVQHTIATDIPADRFSALAAEIASVDISTVRRAVLSPPSYVTPATGPGGSYVLIPNIERIRDVTRDLLAD